MLPAPRLEALNRLTAACPSFRDWRNEAERILQQGSPEATDLADVGVVEDLYNGVGWRVCRGSAIRPEMVRDRLAPRCRKYWNAWDKLSPPLSDL